MNDSETLTTEYISELLQRQNRLQAEAQIVLDDLKLLNLLRLKDVWYRLPTYRNQVYSVDIYHAVLAQDVRTPAEFDEYLVERGKPAR